MRNPKHYFDAKNVIKYWDTSIFWTPNWEKRRASSGIPGGEVLQPLLLQGPIQQVTWDTRHREEQCTSILDVATSRYQEEPSGNKLSHGICVYTFGPNKPSDTASVRCCEGLKAGEIAVVVESKTELPESEGPAIRKRRGVSPGRPTRLT